jgi:putative polyhydroxyalkanoate system protein
MADIRITSKHDLGTEEAARGEVETLAEELMARFGGRWAWRGDVAECEIRGARGRVSCTDSDVTMEVGLPLMMRGLRGPLEREIRRQFERHFLRAGDGA